jgi:cell division protein FtsB
MYYDSRNFLRLSQKAVVPLLIFSIVGYFIYHAIQGERGILAWMHLHDRLFHAINVLEQTVKEKQTLEERVQALRPESINRDFLDQQVRLQLGYSHPDEVVLLRTENPS